MTQRPSPKTTRPYRYVALSFGLLALVLLGAIGYLAFAKAVIILHVTPKPVTASFSITISADPTVERAIAGQYLSTTVEGTAPVSASTAGETPARAAGTIHILNTMNRSQPLALSTRLLSDGGILFRTTRRVDVPAGGSVDVDVEADQPGQEGEIGPSHFTLPGLRTENQKLVYGTSGAAMSGGTSTTTSVSATDISKAKTDLTADLLTKALKEFEKQGNDHQPPFTISILNQTVTPTNQQTKTVVALQLHVTAVAYDPAALDSRIQEELQSSVGVGEEIIDIADDHPLTLRSNDEATKSAIISISASGHARLASGSASITPSQFAGQSRAAVLKTAQSIPGVQNATVQLFPFWSSRTPRSAEKIRVVVVDNS